MAENKSADKIVERDGKRYKEVPVRSAVPIWAAAAVWVLAALVFPMTKIWHLIGIAALSAAAAFAVSALLPKKTKLVELPFTSGNSDLDTTVAAISRSVGAIRAAREKIADKKPAAAAQMTSIAATAEKIRDVLIAQPDDLPKVRRFLNYYLPITEKLTDKYVFVTAQDSSGENIAATSASVEEALTQIEASFRRQHDALFADDALDISTDVTVLETLLARDNLK